MNSPAPGTLSSFLRAFLIPTLINKAVLLYFGLMYSQYPGEGYGWGVILSVAALLINLGRFLWRYEPAPNWWTQRYVA